MVQTAVGRPRAWTLSSISAVLTRERLAHVGKPFERLGDRADFLAEDRRIMEGVVAAGAHHKMRSVARREPKLNPDARGDRAVYREQRCVSAGRKDRVELFHHVGPFPDIGAVVEDRIAEQHDIRLVAAETAAKPVRLASVKAAAPSMAPFSMVRRSA